MELHFRIVVVKFNRDTVLYHAVGRCEKNWEKKTLLFPKINETKTRRELAPRKSKKVPFKPHFPKETAIKHGNRISWRAQCCLNCFSKGRRDAHRTLIRLCSLPLSIAQNQLILIEARAESELMFKASDRQRETKLHFYYMGRPIKSRIYTFLYTSLKVIDKSTLRENRDALAIPSVAGEAERKVIASCAKACTCSKAGLRILNIMQTWDAKNERKSKILRKAPLHSLLRGWILHALLSCPQQNSARVHDKACL